MKVSALYHHVRACSSSDQCVFDHYCDKPPGREGVCKRCQDCPVDVILGISSEYVYNEDCSRRQFCPTWCGEGVPQPSGQTRDQETQACEPNVNVTIGDPLFNTSTNTYSVTCTADFSHLTPSLEWYDPSGTVIKSKTLSGKKTNTLLLHIQDFREEQEGRYLCQAEGMNEPPKVVDRASATVQLDYVPSTTTPFPSSTSLSTARNEEEENVTRTEMSSRMETTHESITPVQKISDPTQMRMVITAVSVTTVALLFIIVISICYVRCRKGEHVRSKHRVPDDALKLHANSVTMETIDFKSVSVLGLQCLWDSDCKEIIVEKVPGRSARKLCLHRKDREWIISSDDDHRNSQLSIPDFHWTDRVDIWRQTQGRRSRNQRGKKIFVKTLKMNCLKVTESVTSVRVECPVDRKMFYSRIGELQGDDPHWIGQPRLITTGEREFTGLRPNLKYRVELGTARGGHSSRIEWTWSSVNQTKSPTFLPIKPEDETATLQLQDTLPESYRLFVKVNTSKEEELHDSRYQCEGLIPGMTQVVQLKIMEEDDFRLLGEETFCTTGVAPLGGNFENDFSTDTEGHQPFRGSRGPLRDGQVSDMSLSCCSPFVKTGQEVARKYPQWSVNIDECTLSIIIKCMKSLFKIYYDTDMKKIDRKKVRNWRGVDWLLSEKGLRQHCSVFDVMYVFAMHSGIGESGFAMRLYEEHRGDRCHLCDHAYFIFSRHSSLPSPS
ncbi:uncharacterized protein [Diadema antillarum]|uniref:uncharacterized protein n=1 Tax=Diadema antillarum TaxID=105358 RepID=UPI003A87FF92